MGKRNFNWELSVGIQQQLLSAVSMDVTYFRRWPGNFIVVDNLAVGPRDYDPFTLIAPRDAVLLQNDAWDSWQTPEEILLARFFKFSVQFDF